MVGEANRMILVNRTFQTMSGRWGMGSREQAVALLHEAQELIPERYEAWNSEAVLHSYAGKKQKASGLWAKAIVRASGLKSPRYDRAFALGQTRATKKACEAWREVLERWPRDARAHANLAHLYGRRRMPADALRHYTYALELEPGLHDVRAARAELASRSDHKGLAETDARAVLAAEPGHEVATRVLVELGDGEG